MSSVPTVLSLALAALATALWTRSYSGSDCLQRSGPPVATIHTISQRTHGIQWTMGQVRLKTSDHTVYLPPDLPRPLVATTALWSRHRLGRGHDGQAVVTGPSIWNRLGFCQYETGSGASFYDETERGLTLPAWLPVALFLILPLRSGAVAVRGRRRRTLGLCASCGYDLRASRDRCPECGLACDTGDPLREGPCDA